MGDFDKVQASSAGNDKGKLKVLGILAVVLVGLVIHFFMKGGPQGANASMISAEGDGLVVKHDETPAQAEASLAEDPTLKLLRGTSTTDLASSELPHNPFEVSSQWRSTLVQRAPAPRPTRHEPILSVTPSSPLSLDGYKLSGVFQQDQRLYAIVNGNMVTVGMTIDDLKVVEIAPNAVTFQRADAPNGSRATLTIEPRLK